MTPVRCKLVQRMVVFGSEPQRKSDSGLRVALPGTRAIEEEHESILDSLSSDISASLNSGSRFSLLVRPLGFYTKTLIVYFGEILSLGCPNLWTLSSWGVAGSSCRGRVEAEGQGSLSRNHPGSSDQVHAPPPEGSG